MSGILKVHFQRQFNDVPQKRFDQAYQNVSSNTNIKTTMLQFDQMLKTEIAILKRLDYSREVDKYISEYYKNPSKVTLYELESSRQQLYDVLV